MFLFSITVGTLEIVTSNRIDVSYISSGLIGGNIAQLLIDKHGDKLEQNSSLFISEAERSIFNDIKNNQLWKSILSL